MSDSATKVHGVSVQYRSGKKMLVKEGKEFVTESQHNGLKTFCTFVGNQGFKWQESCLSRPQWEQV